jgi:Di- and tricarboxylate transporters
MQKRKLMYLILACAVGILFLLFIAPMTGLKPQGQRLLALLAFIVIVWSTEAVSYPVSALLLIVLITLCYIDPAKSMNDSMKAGLRVAMGGLSNTTPLICMAATAFAFTVQKCGLSQRAVFSILRLISGGKAVKARRMLLAIFCVEVPMSVMVPAATGRSAIYLALAEAMQKPFKFSKLDDNGNDTGGNPFQKGVYILCGLLPGMMGAAFLTASPLTLMAGQMIAEGSGLQQTWLATAMYLVLPALLLLVAFYFLILKIYPSTVDDIPMNFVDDRLQELGPMNSVEKYVLLVFLITLGFWVTDKWHGIPLDVTMIAMVIAFYIPHLGPGNWKADSKGFAWNTMLIVGVSLGFVRALTANGVMKFIATWLATFNVTSLLGILILVLSVLIVLRIAVSSNTGAAVLFIPLSMELGKHAGLPATELVCIGWVIYVFCRAGFLLPQQGSQPMLAYDFGYFSRMDQLRLGVPLMGAALAIYIVWGAFIMPHIVQ